MPKDDIIYLRTRCLEMCHKDRLEGYIIFFSGYWDVYRIHPRYGYLSKIGTTCHQEEAVKLFNENFSEYTPEFLKEKM